MSVLLAACERLDNATGRHRCELPAGHQGDCSCRCDPCLGRGDRLASY